MSIFDSDEFNGALFYPRPNWSKPPPDAKDLFVDVPGARIHVRRHGTKGRCQLLLFHGNGEVVSDYDDYDDKYEHAGATLTVADFRGYGASTGRPSLRAAIEDARTIALAVRDDRPLVVMGRSLGGVAAHELYARPIEGMVGVVLESAFTDLGALVKRRGLSPPEHYTDDERATFDACTKLKLGTLPLLVLHGAVDTLIRPAEAHVAHELAGSAKKELVLIAGLGHNNVSFAEEYWAALAAFIASV